MNDGGGLPDGARSSPTPLRFLFFGSFFSFSERKERTEHPVSFPERKERTEHPVSFPERRKRTISDPRPGRAAGGRRARAACRPSPAACSAPRAAPRPWPAMGREKTARVCRRMNESGGAYSGWHVQMVSPFM